jgi:glycosyltransferase involved in cell wall biosynthesis
MRGSGPAPVTIAVLWSRFGPYHLARLRGAAAAAAEVGASVVGLEVACRDRDYCWDPIHGGDGFERVTLFPDASYEEVPRTELARAVTACLDRLRPSAVAVNGWSAAEARAAAAWCRSRRKPAVLMSETKADDQRRPWWKEAVKRQLVRRFDAALVGGRPQADYLAALGFPRERVRYGYDVVDNGYFADGARAVRGEAGRLRREHRLPERFFLACSRFLPRKNIDVLLQAYALYRRRAGAQGWALVVAGSGPEEDRLRRLADGLGLEDVHWPGFVQYGRLPVLFGLAGAFVHPARSEAWGLVVNEAAASGLPLLVSATVGARHTLVRDGENGLVFDPGDREAMARALGDIAGMEEARRSRMGRASERIVADWTPQRFGRELLAAAGLDGPVRSRAVLAS